jgi:hypothetical protein
MGETCRAQILPVDAQQLNVQERPWCLLLATQQLCLPCSSRPAPRTHACTQAGSTGHCQIWHHTCTPTLALSGASAARCAAASAARSAAAASCCSTRAASASST